MDQEVQYLEEKAAQFRVLANEHRAAGHDAIAKKLIEVAEDLVARAAELRAERRSGCGELATAMDRL
jgi:hypothetical protein